MDDEDIHPVDREIRRKKINRSINLLAELQGLKKIINLVDDDAGEDNNEEEGDLVDDDAGEDNNEEEGDLVDDDAGEDNNEEEGDWLEEQILLLNPEKLMGDILDRLEALNVILWAIKKARDKAGSKDDDEDDDEQKEENDNDEKNEEEEDKEDALVGIKNKVFIAAASMTLSKLGQPRWEKKKPSGCLGSVTCSILSLLNAFPDETKLTDGRDCLLTHWAMLAVARPEYDVSVADVKALVTRDPMSMRKHHLTGLAAFQPGLTPAQFLCMQEESESVMALVRHYAIYNPTAFTMCASYPRDDSAETDCDSAIHAACNARCPSKEFLQLMIQLDPSQATKKGSRYGFTPLAVLCHGALCFQGEGKKFNDAVQCLLAVDSSAEYIGDALSGLLYGCCRSKGWAIEDEVASMQQQVLDMMDMLLAINPDAAKYRSNGCNLLHHIAGIPSTIPPQLCIVIMQRILALHADAVRERCTVGGCFPVHLAVNDRPMEVMEFLLGLYPESATATITEDPNLLMYLLRRKNENVIVPDLEAKVRFLCSRYPQLLQQKDDKGNTALFWELKFPNFRLPVVKILCEAGGRDLVSAPKISPLLIAEGDDQDDDDPVRGWLPLHMFIFVNHAQLRSCLPFSDAADCFRMFLRLYPEAVGIEAGVADFRNTPYQVAVYFKVDPYYLRMMLRAVPDLHPAELRRLNYADRRMAMFLAFSAVSTDEHMLLPRLRFENKDLLKRVVSFL